MCPQVVEYVAECGVLRALRIELTPGAGLCGTQPVEGPLRALSCGAGLKIYDFYDLWCSAAAPCAFCKEHFVTRPSRRAALESFRNQYKGAHHAAGGGGRERREVAA